MEARYTINVTYLGAFVEFRVLKWSVTSDDFLFQRFDFAIRESTVYQKPGHSLSQLFE